jgi:hypothetical protein
MQPAGGKADSTPRYTLVRGGVWHTCALRDDAAAVCWGRSGDGQSRPPSGPFMDLALGVLHTCGLRPDGSAVCWGDTAGAEPPEGPFVSLASREGLTCGLRPDGRAACWGFDADVLSPKGHYTALSVGLAHVCGLVEGGRVECVANDDFARARFMAPDATYRAIDSGVFYACGLTELGGARCFGEAQIPDGPTKGLVKLAAGGSNRAEEDPFACALDAHGQATCWGDNSHHQLEAPLDTFNGLTAAASWACGLKTDGTILCWGADTGPLPDDQELPPPPGVTMPPVR